MRKMLVFCLALMIALLAVVPAFAQAPTEVKVWIAFTDNRLDWANQKAATVVTPKSWTPNRLSLF